MSVMCLDEARFAKVANTLISRKFRNGQDLMCLFGYPEGWQNEDKCKHMIKAFCEDLYRANQINYDTRYQEQTNLEHIQNWGSPLDMYNLPALYKTLQSISYNISDYEEDITFLTMASKRLKKVIAYVASHIIDELEEYKQAEW